MELSQLDRKRVAVVIEGREGRSVFRGTARYEMDQDLGNCILVRLSEQPGDPHFLFPESAGFHRFLIDDQYGCDYSVTL